MKEIMMDPAAYYWAPEGKLKGIFVSHVDDAYYCGDEDFHMMIMKPLFEKFKMGQIMEGDFRSLGWNVKTNDRKEITVSQKDYIESKVEKLNILKKKDQLLSSALTDDQTAKLRAKIGMLRWLADQTRPDVAHSCLVLNTKQLAPTWREVKLFNATVDKVLRQPVEILYRKLEPSKWYVTVFCDASHGALNNGNDSCGGLHHLPQQWIQAGAQEHRQSPDLEVLQDQESVQVINCGGDHGLGKGHGGGRSHQGADHHHDRHERGLVRAGGLLRLEECFGQLASRDTSRLHQGLQT